MLTIKNFARITNPPYLLQPAQVANRVWRAMAWRSCTKQTVRLPWGLQIKINPQEAIGHNISTRGIYDLAVTETLWRLCESGELAVDVGANIGYTASLMGVRVGPKGRVLCFEPHPEVFADLRENTEAWQKARDCGSFRLHQVALGLISGVAKLKTDDDFAANRGTARVAIECCEQEGASYQVQMETLDGLLSDTQTISVLKLDVEGSELEVLMGMRRILAERRVRDIVFEEVGRFPAPTHEFLKCAGYEVLGLEAGRWGLRCLPDASPKTAEYGEPPSYLATIDLRRALQRLGPIGWRSFGILRRFAGRRWRKWA